MGKGNEALHFEAPVKGIQLVTYSHQIDEVHIKQLIPHPHPHYHVSTGLVFADTLAMNQCDEINRRRYGKR